MTYTTPLVPPAKALAIWFIEHVKKQKYDPLLHEKQVAYADRILSRGYSASDVEGCIRCIQTGEVPIYGKAAQVVSLALLLGERIEDGKTPLELYKLRQARREFASRPAIIEGMTKRDGLYFTAAYGLA